jgi:hypothetical protein
MFSRFYSVTTDWVCIANRIYRTLILTEPITVAARSEA